ncbi:MAG: acyltransferase [Methylococcales bacterium]|nr:acyltransferase [Methylococcales bacterium]
MLTASFSLYLDFIRFMAAVGVMTGHLSSRNISGGIGWQIHEYVNTCVTVFFVLSGYVIAYVVENKEKTLKSYLLSRFSRLYSVVLIALPLTWLFDVVGSAYDPQLYAEILKSGQELSGYLSALFFVNEYQVFSFNGIAPGSNAPFWSLSFEFTYYIVAALLIFIRPILAIPAIILILLCSGKTIAALMPVWYMGYFLYKSHGVFGRLPKALAVSVAIVSLGIIAIGVPLAHKIMPSDNFGHYFPWGPRPYNRNLIIDYLAAVLFSCHLLAMHGLIRDIAITPLITKAIRWLGVLTFPMYSIHLPAMFALKAISPFDSAGLPNYVYILLSVTLIVIAITPVCEKFKVWLRGKK